VDALDATARAETTPPKASATPSAVSAIFFIIANLLVLLVVYLPSVRRWAILTEPG
jgi:hypothetical protein